MIVTAFKLPTNQVQFSPKSALLLAKASRFQLPLLVLFDRDITVAKRMRIGLVIHPNSHNPRSNVRWSGMDERKRGYRVSLGGR